MNELYEELRNKIDSSDTEELTKIQEEVVEAENNGNITGDEAHRLKEAIANRLGGFNL